MPWGILLQVGISVLTRWPNWGRVSRSRIGSARTTTVKRSAQVMLGGQVAWHGAERKFGIKARWPAIAAAVAMGATKNGHIVLREIHTGIIPRVAISTVSRLHRHKRCLGGIARSVFEKRSRRGRVILAADKRRKRGDTTRLPEPFEDRSTIAGVIGEIRPSRGIRHERSRCVLEQFRVEKGQRLFERVGLGTGDRTLDRSGIKSVGDKSRDQEVDGIFQSTCIVPSVSKHDAILGRSGRVRALLLGGRLVDTRFHRCVHFILFLQLGTDIVTEVGRFEKVT